MTGWRSPKGGTAVMREIAGDQRRHGGDGASAIASCRTSRTRAAQRASLCDTLIDA